MRRNLVILFLLLVNYIVSAVPSRKCPFIVTQQDGTDLELTLIGDERFHYYITEDSIPVLPICKTDTVSYFYAMIKGDAIIPSCVLAHSKERRSVNEKQFISSQRDVVWQGIENKQVTIRRDRIRMSSQSNGNQYDKTSFKGHKRGLVILVNFANLGMVGDDPQENINRQFNEVGYKDNGHIGSVHDYFYDQSYGQFDLTFDIVGPLTVSREFAYYGTNDYATGRNDIRIGRMVTEACLLADDDIDYSLYDWDSDGIVEQVYFIYAGYGEASGGAPYTIWPHKFSLTGCEYYGDGDGPLILDGVKIDTYACSNELTGASNETLNGIGTACHEFSHCLGLPDLYDTDYSGAFGMGCWDIMDSGSYSGPTGNGEVPYGYSAYEKTSVGWMELSELSESSNCILPSIGQEPVAYKITNSGSTDEFFVLENHQNEGWYGYLGTYQAPSGMMITHIDYNSLSWRNNTVNTSPLHMRESIVPADRNYGTFISDSKIYHVTEDEYAGDLFPGHRNATRFTSMSYENCGGKLFNENAEGTQDLHITIDNIVEYNGVILFSIGLNLEKPENIQALQIGSDKICIQWDIVKRADKYAVEILKMISLQPVNIEKEVIEDIHDTSITIEIVNCNQLSVRVKAINEYVSSEWSEYANIKISTNGIAEIESVLDNGAYYTIDGLKVKTPDKQGIYIQIENNQKRKIYISK